MQHGIQRASYQCKSGGLLRTLSYKNGMHEMPEFRMAELVGVVWDVEACIGGVT